MIKLQCLWKSLGKFVCFILLILIWSFILINRIIEIILYTIEAYWSRFYRSIKYVGQKIYFFISLVENVVTCCGVFVAQVLDQIRTRILVYKHTKNVKKKYKQKEKLRWMNKHIYEGIPNKFKETVLFMRMEEDRIINKYTAVIRDHYSFKLYYCGFLLRLLIRLYYMEFERFILYVHNKKFQATIFEWYLLYYIYEYYFWPFLTILILYELRIVVYLVQFWIMDQLYPMALRAKKEGNQEDGQKIWVNFVLFFAKYIYDPYYEWTQTRMLVLRWIHYFYLILITLLRFDTLCMLLTFFIFSPFRWIFTLLKFCISLIVFHTVKFLQTTPFEKLIIQTAFDLEKSYYLKINEYIEWREAWKAFFDDTSADFIERYVYIRVSIERSLDETLMDLWLLGLGVQRSIFLKYQVKKLVVSVFFADIRRILLLYYYFCFLWQIFVFKMQVLWFYETVLDFPFYLIVLTWIHYWEFFKVSMIIEAFLVTEFYLLYLSYRYKAVPFTIIDSLLITRYLILGAYKIETLKLKYQIFSRYPFIEIYWTRLQIRFWRLVIVWLKFTQVVYIVGRVLLNIIDLLTLGGLSYAKLWIMDRYWTSFFYYYINGHKKKK